MRAKLCVKNIRNKESQLSLIAAFKNSSTKSKGKQKTSPIFPKWPKGWKKSFDDTRASEHFKGERGETFLFALPDGTRILTVGLGKQSDYTAEILRREIAKTYNEEKFCQKITVELDSFILKKNIAQTVACIGESLGMSSYSFKKYFKKNPKGNTETKEKTIDLLTSYQRNGLDKQLKETEKVVESIKFCRDLVNEPPNVLNSETYAKKIEGDARKLKGVRVKSMGRNDLKREKMGMFLSVNAGSAYEPRLVHLTYTPTNTKKRRGQKHIALVGKGLTFDTGGYSIKPPSSIINMKFDMAGSATVYGAFRAVALLGLNVKVSCFLGMTDNAISSKATMPDSIVTARNGKNVEILNTDAEGRLVLGDVLSYACDQKPDCIIDAATLTGAVLVSLGNEICGLMGNNQQLIEDIKKSAQTASEYIWELPIIEEFKKDMKSTCADLKNIGGSRFAGSSKAAAFLQNFIAKDIPWAHLDIAGVADSQTHLPYCPDKGASGLIVRTLVNYITSQIS